MLGRSGVLYMYKQAIQLVYISLSLPTDFKNLRIVYIVNKVRQSLHISRQHIFPNHPYEPFIIYFRHKHTHTMIFTTTPLALLLAVLNVAYAAPADLSARQSIVVTLQGAGPSPPSYTLTPPFDGSVFAISTFHPPATLAHPPRSVVAAR